MFTRVLGLEQERTASKGRNGTAVIALLEGCVCLVAFQRGTDKDKLLSRGGQT